MLWTAQAYGLIRGVNNYFAIENLCLIVLFFPRPHVHRALSSLHVMFDPHNTWPVMDIRFLTRFCT